MAGVNDDLTRRRQPASPIAHRGAISTRAWLLGTLLFLIAVSAIVGVVVAAVSGQTTVALIIALFAGAFFSRVAC
jgi:uncharacterized metal-binding protein